MDFLIEQFKKLQKEQVSEYIQNGWQITPIKFRDKKPILNNWQETDLTQGDINKYFFNGSTHNVGVRLGSVSKDLVDIDLDCEEALKIAGLFLPVTRTFGREGKKASHRLYYSTVDKSIRYDFSKTLLELRTTGQTVFPPSVHPSGDLIKWENDLPIRHIHPSELYKITGKIASACVISKFWYEGSRQDISLCLSKILLEAKWPKKEIEKFFEAICLLSGDTDLKQRVSGLYATEKKIGKKQVWGIPKFKEFTSDKCVDKVMEWLQLVSEKEVEKTKEREKRNKLQVFTAEDIMNEVYSPLRYIVEGIIPEGMVILAGRPKTCKSFFALNLSLAVAGGKPAFKKLNTEKTGVFYFAIEDGKGRLDKRMKTILGEDWKSIVPKNLRFSFKMDPLDCGGIEQLEEILQDYPDTGVIIIDPFAKVKPASRGGNAYEADYKIAGQLQSWAIEKRITLFLVHHTRKSNITSDWQDEISGSNGLIGAADVLMVMDKRPNEDDAILKIKGREVQEQELAFRFSGDDFTWTLIGEATFHKLNKERQEIVNVLKQNTKPMPLKEVSEILNKSYNSVRRLVWKMELDGIVTKVAMGRYILSNIYINNNTGNSDNTGNSGNSDNTGNSKNTNTVTDCYRTVTDKNNKKTGKNKDNSITVTTVTAVTAISSENMGNSNENTFQNYIPSNNDNTFTPDNHCYQATVTGNSESGNSEKNDNEDWLEEIPF